MDTEWIAARFRHFAQGTSRAVGNPITFILACLSIIIWACFGPVFKYSDTWQLVINTSTTIITFLMVFLIQNTQNRDYKALNLKIDELILSNKKSRNYFLGLEELSDKELEELEKHFQKYNEKKLDKIK